MDDKPIFTMDGEDHFNVDGIDSDDCWCTGSGKRCSCGGYMHYQPMWGGYYYKCEKCLKEI